VDEGFGVLLIVPGSLLTLCLAMFVGGMIGWERQLRNKPAGLITHMLERICNIRAILILWSTPLGGGV